MRRRAMLALILTCAMFMGSRQSSTVVAQQQAPRLIADNRTQYYVDVLVWNGNGWNFVSRLNPLTWSAFPNAAPNSMWRAVIGQVVRDHRVVYVYDRNYNGLQDVWWIQ